jgi:beta-galactosidase
MNRAIFRMRFNRWSTSLPRLAVLGAVLLAAGAVRAADAPRERLLMDAGWKFHLGEEPRWGNGEDLAKVGSSTGPAAGAARGRGGRTFNDSSWRTVNLPHDWAIELPFDQNANLDHGFKPLGPGFATNSIGWYRKSFVLPKEDAGKRLWLEFDGVYRNCRVFLNGYEVGHFESGYSSFRLDITDVANPGGTNALAVRVDASQFEGWFYEGAGIYRHVWLVKTSPLAIAPDGTFVYSEFKDNLPKGPAKIQIETELGNSQKTNLEARVKWEILGPDGRTVAHAEKKVKLAAWSAVELKQTTSVSAPALWSPETPVLYKLVTTVESGGKIADRTETEFGIRTLAFDANKGFLLNGQPYVIKGTCNHQDHAGVGAALPDRLQYFRIQRLKDMGGNAYRTSHNPPTPELLEACDRLGMLVMDESRSLGSDAANLWRLVGQVRRDRNHPSVFIWSIGNEESAVHATPAAARITASMQTLLHQLDPSREATYAANEGDVFSGVNSVIDIRGWNYNLGNPMDNYHKEHPAQPNIGTEQASTLCTRGIYTNDRAAGYMSAFDDNAPAWGHTAERWWTFFAARPWLTGGFVWTGFDYRGEPTPYRWPCINSHFGIMDTCGFAKDNFYYYLAWWTDKPVLHLAPHWNWPGREGQEIDVRCFSNCEEVELFLNGESLGRQAVKKNSHLQWQVKYAPGTLRAVGYRAGRVAMEEKVETTDAPAALKLTPDRGTINADGEDLSIITIAVTDAKGRVVPLAGNLVNFEISGPGKIIGVGNGDPSCHEPDVYLSGPDQAGAGWKRSVFNGLAQIIVQAGRDAGEIKLTARADGLADNTITIHAGAHAPRPAVP